MNSISSPAKVSLSIGLQDHFSKLKDPRIKKKIKHNLIDIVVITICAAICGADDWVSVEEYGKAKLDWLKTFLEIPNGIPSHDTFGNVFSVLSSTEFEECFLSWIQSVCIVTAGQVIAKAGWNYFLLHGDGSEGVHNPSFTLTVINASLSALE